MLAAAAFAAAHALRQLHEQTQRLAAAQASPPPGHAAMIDRILADAIRRGQLTETLAGVKRAVK